MGKQKTVSYTFDAGFGQWLSANVPPGIDPERIRIRRVDGESELAFRAVGDLPEP
jgi:hypothetical protein